MCGGKIVMKRKSLIGRRRMEGKFDGGGMPNLIKSKSTYVNSQYLLTIYTSHSANTASTWPSWKIDESILLDLAKPSEVVWGKLHEFI